MIQRCSRIFFNLVDINVDDFLNLVLLLILVAISINCTNRTLGAILVYSFSQIMLCMFAINYCHQA